MRLSEVLRRLKDMRDREADRMPRDSDGYISPVAHGYRNLDALDTAVEMLDSASTKALLS